MKVSIHQPEHLPWLGFFDKMNQVDVFVLLDTTQYARRDFQNRNRIKTEQGPVWLTVPVVNKGKSEQTIMETEIFNDNKWQNRCWQLLHSSYKNTPYWAQHEMFFKDLYHKQWSKLVDLNITIIRYLAAQLGIKTTIITSSELGVNIKGSTKVLATICKELNATSYLSGIMGKDYLDEMQFEEHGIKVNYQEFHHPTYPQLWGEFVSNLSLIDLLFNCGDASLEIIADASNQLIPTPVEINKK
jgi:hypothetical protein